MTKDLQGSSHHLKVVGGAYGKQLAVVVRPEMCSDITGRCDQLQAESILLVFLNPALMFFAGFIVIDPNKKNFTSVVQKAWM